jgi:hypothetical protein
MVLKFVWKRPRIERNMKENKVGGLTPPNFNTYYEAAVVNTVWYW